jgi:glutamate N-acetyltransferase / amino-acid N-acetyltransferase
MEIKGFKFSAVKAAIKKPGRLDMGLIFSETPAVVTALFTTNKLKAAPVLISMERAQESKAQAILVNSGNANACTGQQGMDDARELSRLIAEGLGIPDEATLTASTGVIGVPLPMERIRKSIPPLIEGLASGELADLAQAIMTTDTFPKLETRQGEADGKLYTIAGIAKGAGMIMPNMATMLAFLVTDAAVDPAWLEKVFREANSVSFNSITIDGDTSTNDTALILANGAAENSPLCEAHHDASRFTELLQEVMMALAKQLVKDGEGATKLVTITVKGAVSNSDARQAALAIANSSLVKTSFFGQDANWGRILAAVGYSGAQIDPGRAWLFFDDVVMAKNGIYAGGDAEALGTAVLKNSEFSVTVDLNLGEGQSTVLTTDLSYDYVKINADYRT